MMKTSKAKMSPLERIIREESTEKLMKPLIEEIVIVEGEPSFVCTNVCGSIISKLDDNVLTYPRPYWQH